jgi:hypothetical protein
VTGEGVAAGWPLPALLDLLARYYAGRHLVIRDVDDRLVAVKYGTGEVSLAAVIEAA